MRYRGRKNHGIRREELLAQNHSATLTKKFYHTELSFIGKRGSEIRFVRALQFYTKLFKEFGKNPAKFSKGFV